MCDIERMFHRFHVTQEDREYLRFLWWKKADLSIEPHEYCMKVHLFGAASSLGCADYGLRHLAKEYKEMYLMGSLFIMRDFYVADGIASVDRPEEAIQLADEAKKFVS